MKEEGRKEVGGRKSGHATLAWRRVLGQGRGPSGRRKEGGGIWEEGGQVMLRWHGAAFLGRGWFPRRQTDYQRAWGVA